ncbi:MAG: hypothetical protein BWK79_14175 [Beggiatoa sp. IS2]|nr:MAG: hypothetical protein BWK79_14175 [Beggiatoa sp. IS2]
MIKKMLWTLFLIIMVFIVVIEGCNVWVEYQTQERIYSDINEISTKNVALVLGANKFIKGGQINLYFKYRMDAAEQLYKTGKVKHLLVSGDNRSHFYNEPIDMKKSLMQRGIPEQAITLDYAGLRTLDSIVRAKEIFSQDDFIIVSQAFHNQRALFICDFYGIKAIGFNAHDVPFNSGIKVKIREYFARLKVVLDLYILKTQPRFLGEKEDISI